jgi:DNA-binding NarL/FixJ family response regulator
MPFWASPQGPDVRALVVDDHPLIQEAVSNILRRLEPQVAIDVAGDCEGGLDLAGHGTEPDLVLLDLNLPGLSGIPALKLWRTRYPGIPVVVLSAATDQQTVLAAIGAGAAGFIPKSASNAVMLNAPSRICRWKVPHPRSIAFRGDESPAASTSGRRRCH